MKNILVVGSSNTDMVIRVSRIPRPGETVLGGEFTMAPGGKGANQAVAAARAGGHVTFVARVGKDVFGERALANFQAPDSPSGIALINVDGKGENSISVASGANACLSAGDIEKADEAFAAADIVLLQLEIPMEAVSAAVKKARDRGVPVILNPAPARPLGDGLLSLVTVLTPNELEAEFLTGIPVRDHSGAREAAVRLRGRGVVSIVITLGERGAFASSPEFEGLVPAFKVEAVDTTAAGDVFNGALAVALAEKVSMEHALRFASAAAALSVTRPGAQPSAPVRSEIEGFLSARLPSIGR
jgi:ribokinase